MDKKRLNKVLAASGIASRRKCDELIFSGKVTINGEIVQLPQTHVNPEMDIIRVNGKKIFFERKIYYVLNKPVGIVCSASRTTPKMKIIEDLFNSKQRLFTAGRLDKETSGLIIVTNDGDLANRIAHPSFNVQKEYLIKTSQEITDDHLRKLSAGTYFSGTRICPIRVIKVRRGTLKIVVSEGKKHEVRILAASAGLKILELCRIRIGPITLGKLPIGCWRELSEQEVNYFLSRSV